MSGNAIGLRILSAGPGVTIQDGGREGYLRYGVTVAGPMDPFAHAVANRALGNAPGAAAIEVSLGGLDVTSEGKVFDMAVAGGDFRITLDGRLLPPAVTFRLLPGMKLSIRPGNTGSWAYLAFGGTIGVPPVLGSQATHVRSRLGGLDGGALKAGDLLPLVPANVEAMTGAEIRMPALNASAGPVRILPGPQDDCFSPEAFAAFLAGSWRVAPRSDRMAYALEGEPISHLNGHDIVSDGIAHGAVQVPGSGLPFILMADRQPTGGYPKIATVIGADLGRVAQLRPGETLRFAEVTMAAALAARHEMQALLGAPIPLVPLIRTDLTSEELLSCNLISGVTRGH